MRDAYFGSMDKAFEGFTFVDESAAQHMRGGASLRGYALSLSMSVTTRFDHATHCRKSAVSGGQATLMNMKKR